MRSLPLRRSAPGLASSSRCTSSIPSSARAVTGPCRSSPTSESQGSSRRSSPPSACEPRTLPARPHRLRRNAGRPTFCRGPVSTFPSRQCRLRRVSRRASLRTRSVGDARRTRPAQALRLTCGPGLRYPRCRLVSSGAAADGPGPAGLSEARPKNQIPDMEWPVKKKNLRSSFPPMMSRHSTGVLPRGPRARWRPARAPAGPRRARSEGHDRPGGRPPSDADSA